MVRSKMAWLGKGVVGGDLGGMALKMINRTYVLVKGIRGDFGVNLLDEVSFGGRKHYWGE